MVLVIDPQIAGISGDMLLCSLVDLGANENKIIEGIENSKKYFLNSSIKKISFQKVQKHGIQATELILKIHENTQKRKGSEIKKAIIDSLEILGFSEKAKIFVKSCIATLITAESKIHGVSEDSVHFHEASSIDTFVDIIGVAIALDDLNLFDENIVCLPICVGSGSLTFSHGTTSNPASAILEIFKNSNLKIQGNSTKDELTTPTGACILVSLTNNSVDYYPSIKIDSIGYGAGQKNFQNFSNVLKIIRGSTNHFEIDSVAILETNVDDISGEILGDLTEKIMEKGAKDISIFHGITKKGRPTNLISVICNDVQVNDIIETLVFETGTLGIRISNVNRFIVPRSNHTVKIKLDDYYFQVSYKKSFFKGTVSFKIEFDDLKQISKVIKKPIKETESLLRKRINYLENHDDKA
ncbi:nickel pincer cofactor biosynthesis protein LarC [Nitrosopumilus sp.]|uniref:nickel pincer cofactor biosynthesis protein LarC n=1 Tax=Nitrosopumilus sp. TaxID=2024843 RepID=UPI0029313E64|nr:nickel pincer cofactor biosynthesis protein LarC [Nitrosopumilus sp.]